MKIPRHLKAIDLIKSLKAFGYSITRQTGSHIRLTTNKMAIIILQFLSQPLKIGTINSFITDITRHLDKSKYDLLKKLFR